MNSKSMIMAMVSVAVVVVLITTTIIPMVDEASKEKIDIIGNDNPSWIRMSYYTTKLDSNVDVSYNTQYTVGPQSGTDDVIFYADSSSVIYSEAGIFWLSNDIEKVMLSSPFTIAVSGYITTVNDGNEYVLPQHSWMYFPDPDGHCTTYYNTGFRSDTPVAAVSETFAGVRCYNNEDGIRMTVVKNGETVENVYWGKDNMTNSIQSPLSNAPLRNGTSDYTYTVDTDNKAIITRYTGADNIVVIPSEIDGYEVKEIGGSAFSSNNNLFGVVIPDTVISIGSNAFSNCFSLQELTIGKSVETIGDRAFYDCIVLTSVIIPNSVTTIGEQAFQDCNEMSNLTIGYSVREIGENAFVRCYALTSVIIPNSVETMGMGVFIRCTSLQTVVIGNSLTEIGPRMFEECTSLQSVTLGNSITKIGYSAFIDCYSLSKISIPKSVTEIGDGAFIGCYSLTTITFVSETRITSIGSSAFALGTSAHPVTTRVESPNNIQNITSYGNEYTTFTFHPLIPSNEKRFILRYDGNDATGGTMDDNVVSSYNTVEKLILNPCGFEKTNYTFTGWKINNIGTTYQPGEVLEIRAGNTVRVYAQWSENPRYDHTVIYDGNGGTGTMSDTVVNNYNSGESDVPLSNCGFTKNYYTFAGWLVDGTVYDVGDTVRVNGNDAVVATAVWELTTYTSGDWTYTLGEGMTITGYTGPLTGTVVIPDKIDGFSVERIGNGTPIVTTDATEWSVELGKARAISDNAFKDCTKLVGTVTLPSEIRSIGHNVFQNTGITGIVSYLNNTATVESDAFANSSVTEVLNLGTMNIQGDSFGLNSTVKDQLQIVMCVGDNADSYTKIIGKGGVFDIVPLISIIIVAGLLIGVVGMIFVTKKE